MPRLLNALGFILFVLGAIVVGYVLYLVIAGMLGWNPFGGQRPAVGLNTVIMLSIIALLLLVGGWLVALAAVRAEWRRDMQAA
ncbi:hypothetical protein [Muricoccus radiodurans]|uniref:hypothetical protein n=1 Tax=Muricoccus radiodurans TaxID=2231721 RepID=UPI003CF7A9C8